jgi:hypothetical protein
MWSITARVRVLVIARAVFVGSASADAFSMPGDYASAEADPTKRQALPRILYRFELRHEFPFEIASAHTAIT